MTRGAQVDQGLPPWQFFLLGGMLGATAVVIVATGQSIANIIILSLTVVSVSFVGLGAYRMLAPLVSPTVPARRSSQAAGRASRSSARRRWCCERSRSWSSISRWERWRRRTSTRWRAAAPPRAGADRSSSMPTCGYREQIAKELASLVTAAVSVAPRHPALRHPRTIRLCTRHPCGVPQLRHDERPRREVLQAMRHLARHLVIRARSW